MYAKIRRWLQLPAYWPGCAFSAGSNHCWRKPSCPLRSVAVAPVSSAATSTVMTTDRTRSDPRSAAIRIIAAAAR